jgi:hypothetical protein
MRASVLFASITLTLTLAACFGGNDDYDGEVVFHTRLVQYADCGALEDDLKNMMVGEVEAQFDQSRDWFGEDADAGSAGEGDGDSGGGREEGEDFSGTNNQEDGVDEADFVKTDGYHVYVLNGNRFHVFAVPEFGQLEPVSDTPIEGMPRQMLVSRDADRAVIFSYVYADQLPEDHPLRERIGRQAESGWMWRVWLVSKITVLDISDRAAPTLVRELFLEGWYQTARMVDGSVRVGAYASLNIPGLYDWWYYYNDQVSLAQAKRRAIARIRASTLAELVPTMYERTPDGELTERGLTTDACRSYHRPENSHGRGLTSILSMNLFGDGVEIDATHVVSNYATLYSSTDTLILAEPANDWWWFWWNEDIPEQLNVHAFDISTPGETHYLASGRVAGRLHNQFSIDEEEGFIRVATTDNMFARWWREDAPEPDNHLFVLTRTGDTLTQIGHVGGIAEGERIFSARMVGDRGYMVTFRNIDPLFTFDLSDPFEPKLVGELEIPGFSTYIHPIANDKLLTTGVGGDEEGANWLAQISMFDVSNFAEPQRTDVEELVGDDGWGWSEALYEHKAFQYWAPAGLLAVPVSSYADEPGGWRYLSRLELISVDPESGQLGSYGQIDHSQFFNSDPERYWYYRDVRRSIFMGDYIYAISDRGITVHTTAGLQPMTQEQLPGYSPDDWYWWW